MTACPIPLPDVAADGPGRGGSGAPTPRDLTDISKLKRATTEEADRRNELALLLVLDNLVDAGEAETRWLDHVGTRLTRRTTCAPRARARDTAGSPIHRSTESAPR
ncbi:MAG TPA: hypothetical protein VF391_01565 [Dermatophilaceae bacterium]|jgi:hypothetical protein